MKLLPTCNEVEAQLTELTEGTLPLSQRFGIRLHILMCRPCARLLKGMRALPWIGKRLLGAGPGIPPEALHALENARSQFK